MSLNDPRWGRTGDDQTKPEQTGGETPKNEAENTQPAGSDAPRTGAPQAEAPRGDMPRAEEPRADNNSRPRQQQNGAADLDQLWDDFNRALGGLLGGRGQANRGRNPQEKNFDDCGLNDFRPDNGGDEPPSNNPPSGRGNRSRFPKVPDGVGFGLGGIAVLACVAVVAWAASGFYIVPEGQVGVVTTFGKYTKDASAGFNWRMPWPIQEAEIVDVSSVRKAEIGIRGTTSRLREALMLTDDENIVDVQFNVQYRIRPNAAKDYLFKTRDPDQSVVHAAESAMREVVGRKTMDSVLFESKQEIAESVKTGMQSMLDRYNTGIEVMSVAIQNAQPPEQVQAAFNDAVKAGQDRERQINEGEAYANGVIPKARGMASRLNQEAEGYKARVTEAARGDAERFKKILAQYEKAPEVTRDRLYVDIMKELYANSSKILVDTKTNNNLLYLPLDKLMEKSAAEAKATDTAPQSTTTPAVQAPAAVQQPVVRDIDPREMLRLRGR